ncbi:MAG: glucosamine-6-phosphate deaminase [Gemmatimonadales bacterium]|nr:MAG: glucosamine-6-phosphate deaminase [Gemmatimonadales bacterium]
MTAPPFPDTPDFRRLERIPVTVLPDHAAIARDVAARIARLVLDRAASGQKAVLGLATGSTPLGIYRELIRLHRDEGLDLSNVVTFNLDEYLAMDPESVHSYHRYMRENLFDHVNIPSDQVHIPRGDLPPSEVEEHCRAFEQAIAAAGGIDLQVLGIGRSGHVGFNEPGSGRESRTRVVYLDTVTRADAASDFFGEENVPLQAVTMGVATIMEAREVVLIATGEHKAAVIRRAVEGEVSSEVAATHLQGHPATRVYLDPAAAAELTRVRTPWLLGEVEWTPRRKAEAVLWLSDRTSKPVLHLSTKDYRDHHLSSLVSRRGSAEALNGEVFNSLISKIRGRSRLPAGRTVLVFSPHPDDDVISMGGILRKLVENGNRVTVAYQTSGNIAVFDHEVRRYLEFLRRAGPALGALPEESDGGQLADVQRQLAEKPPGALDGESVLALKRAIRETEALSALEAVGLGRDDARFLDLPFYRTGTVRKDPISERDVERVLEVLREVEPDIAFAAGDLSDPHGTHRQCLDVVEQALARYAGEPPELWLYRGAWHEWSSTEASVLVPLSAEELRRKILAIFKHQSQKDVAPFPGPDPREFWQRVEERNRGTAERLRLAGLPAYYAMEAYVVLQGGEPRTDPPLPTAALAESTPPAVPSPR